MKPETLSHATFRAVRHLPHYEETVSGFGEPMTAPPEPSLCSGCGAVLRNGEWQWSSDHSIGASLMRCPACVRVQQKKPAGQLMLQGDFALQHRNEMLSLINHIETREKTKYPLKRIMWIEYQEEGITIASTDMQLIYSFANALQQAYKGELFYHLNEKEEVLCARWSR